ncbi:hypothetical protein SCHPADRAFT_1001560 [Schizopora paradoxa]|uniref:Uncharacterized protein n=1 Tax=Schizopora paradoxa TaxID=27342 RepID=A0A0H2R6W2_9AGAM|nr:hypothetical protein SCHPADRAFT_1001560 [Schizopora paradoxa]
MPKARSTRSTGSKKSNRDGKKKPAPVDSDSKSSSSLALAVKAEELSDIESKQLLKVDTPELTCSTNHAAVTAQEIFTTTTDSRAFAPFGDLASREYSARTPGLSVRGSSPASSDLLPTTPREYSLLESLENNRRLFHCGYVRQPMAAPSPAPSDLSPAVQGSFSLDSRGRLHLWPAEDDIFAKAYFDYLHVPCPEPIHEQENTPSAPEVLEIEIPRAYTQEKECTPKPHPQLELVTAPNGPLKSVVVDTKVKLEPSENLLSDLSSSKPNANRKYKLVDAEARIISSRKWMWEARPSTRTRFFYGWNSRYRRFQRLSRKDALVPVVLDQEAREVLICGGNKKDGSPYRCALCYVSDEVINLVDDDDDATTQDLSDMILPPTIEISLAAPETAYSSPNHILSPPSVDRYVKLIPSKAMELSAIPFLNAFTLSL